ncbi:hypothetical protein GCM10009830_27220 [Glycomyces endophyticus]|uniref:Carrier domain-containing protein n=1 Tax=Glycomyces endophyticus TaxID=480996 RepID=A0ABN2GXU5_9ACTN
MNVDFDMDRLERALALHGECGPDGCAPVRETLALPPGPADPEALVTAAALLLDARYSGREAAAVAVTGADGAVRVLGAATGPAAAIGDCVPREAAADPAGCALAVDLLGKTDHPGVHGLVFGCSASASELTLTAVGHSHGDDPGWTARALGHLAEVVAALTEAPGTSVGGLEILTAAERDAVFGRFNPPPTAYPRGATLVELFKAQVAAGPDRPAVVRDGESLSYRDLDERSDALARTLMRRGVRAGDRVALLADKVPHMVVATVAILKCGAAYVPVDPAYPADRRAFLLSDCGIEALVAAGVDVPPAPGVAVVDAAGPHEAGGELPSASTAPGDTAYVIYTSGSTGNPKGVVVPHRGVVRLATSCDYLDLSPDTRLLQTCAIVFDVTTMELWGPLLNGGSIALVPDETLLDAAALGAQIARHRITTMWLTAPLLHLLVDQDPSIFAPLRQLIAGGDVLSGPHIAALMAACPDLEVLNGYGPTENTTFSTAHRIAAAPEGRVPIGRPIPNSTAYVLDAAMRPQPVGLPGELYTGGDGVADGYRNRPDLTARVFGDDPFAPGGRLYRTGDLVRWLPDGTIDFLGRVDNQVKIRGFRIEPGEVEQHLNALGGVLQSAVLVRSRGGEKYLCAYCTGDDLSPERLREELGRTLPDYMVPAVFTRLDSMPLNRSGKIDRGALARLEPEAGEAVAVEGDEVERAVAAMWRDALGAAVGLDDDLFGLGVSSLTTAVVAGRIHRELGVRLPAARLLAHPTARRIAALVRGAGSGGLPPLVPAPDRAVYPVSAQQRRIIVEQAKDEAATHYNLPVQIRLPEPVDHGRLESALRALAARHEALRTGFVQMGAETYQRIHEEVAVPVAVLDDPESWRPLPFDLSAPPLLRAWRSADGRLVVLDLHHAAVDGRSLEVLLDDLDRLYRGERLPDLPLRYRDYAVWQRGEGGDAVREQQEAFWLRAFAERPEPLELPTDRPRGPVREYGGARLGFALGEARTAGLRDLARREEATLFHALAAAYFVFLHRITGQTDLTAGLPVDGRGVGDVDGVAGMFANTLCLRARIRPGQPFTAFLREVRDDVIAAFTHADHQFDELVAAVGGERDFSRNPLFDTMLAYGEAAGAGRPCLGGTARQDDSASAASMFDLNLQFAGTADLTATWAYNSRLFHERTAKSFVDALLETVDAVLADPGAPALAAPEADGAGSGLVFDF